MRFYPLFHIIGLYIWTACKLSCNTRERWVISCVWYRVMVCRIQEIKKFNGTSVTSCVYCFFYLRCCVKTTLKRLFQTKHAKINIWEGINKTSCGMSSVTERQKSANHKTFSKSLTNGMLELFRNLKTIFEFISILNSLRVSVELCSTFVTTRSVCSIFCFPWNIRWEEYHRRKFMEKRKNQLQAFLELFV